MPQINDYHQDAVLTNLSVGYKNMEYIADMIAPRVQVPARTGYYYTFDKSKLKSVDDRRTGITRAKRVDYAMTKTAFGPLYERSLEEGIEYEIRDTYPTPHDARVDATENVSERLLINQEKDVAGKLADTAIMTQNITLSGTDQFSDYANSDPFSVIQTGMDTVVKNAMVPVNSMLMSYEVFSKLRNHPDLLNRMAVTGNRVLSEQQMADLFGVQNLYVGKAVENTAQDGQTDALSFIWGKHIVLFHKQENPGIKKVSLAYTLQVQNARFVDRWDEPAVKAEFVRANDYYETKIVAAEAGYLIKNAIA